MCEVTDYSDSENSSSDMKSPSGVLPKVEVLDYDFPSQRRMGDNVASSSGSNLRSSFIGMGFAPNLVDKVIEEKGEDNIDLLLETLFAHSAAQKSYSESSDSLNSLFGDEKDTCGQPSMVADTFPKEEGDTFEVLNDERRASLLNMNFSVHEVDYALHKLGDGAPISEIVDFIFAFRMAETADGHINVSNHDRKARNEESNTETLFGIMDKTIHLLQMGFSEHEVSLAIEKYGSEIPVAILADAIAAHQIGEPCIQIEQYASTSYGTSFLDEVNHGSLDREINTGSDLPFLGSLKVKTEDCLPDDAPQFRDIDLMAKHRGKRPIEEHLDEPSDVKLPKEEYGDDIASLVGLGLLDTNSEDYLLDRMTVACRKLPRKAIRREGHGVSKISKPHSCDSLNKMVAKPPYFFFGDVMNLSDDAWVKISQFLYAIEPEFVNSQLFSALSRKEGYVHSLPTQKRVHIVPKSPLTIQEAVPITKSWWPSWDTRKQLSCITSQTTKISQLCSRLEKALVESSGMLSVEQQRLVLNRCQALNLVWVGRYKLAPLEPEHLEVILGYPLHHTRIAEVSHSERLELLKYCFQTDTLGYHISALKTLFPEGLNVLSVYSGIGGAEIALHRLGVHLKAVVSVEPSETNRKILKLWWQKSEQSGKLEQIEGIHKLTSNKLDDLIRRYGGFDFIFCQNPDSSILPKPAAVRSGFSSFDFPKFYEFVRVLQRVRSTMERNK